MSDKLIDQLRQAFAYRSESHIVVSTPKEISVWRNTEHWIKECRPFVWKLHTEIEDYRVYTDFGYGYMAVFNSDNDLIGTGKDEIITSNVVVINGNYYSGLDDISIYERLK